MIPRLLLLAEERGSGIPDLDAADTDDDSDDDDDNVVVVEWPGLVPQPETPGALLVEVGDCRGSVESPADARRGASSVVLSFAIDDAVGSVREDSRGA